MAQFTKQDKRHRTILLPEMMEYHFKLIAAAFQNAGYKMEVLDYKNEDISLTGLEFCHNDICYPCIQITGQLISALRHKVYDPKDIAFLIPQAGGLCRAPNYYYLIKNALKESGFEEVPVISLNLGGKEKNPGFKLSLKLGFSLIAGALYGDLLQALYLKERAYEKEKGQSFALYRKWEDKLSLEISHGKSIRKRDIKRNARSIIKEFKALEKEEKNPPKVGIAGELYIKSCRLGNRNLEDFLAVHDADYFMSGFTTYCLYVADTSLYQAFSKRKWHWLSFLRGWAMKWLDKKQSLIATSLHEEGYVFFTYSDLRKRKSVLDFECSTADGWLVAEEIVSLIESGYSRILVTVPFGCLVSHVASKGVIREILKRYPDTVISSIEYDSSIPAVTQENRIRMVLQN